MAELPSDEDNELNFSDYDANSDSDDDDNIPRAPTSAVIAHKEMKTVQISDAEEDSEKDDSDREESDKEEATQELEFETISPPAEQTDHEDNNKISTVNKEADKQTFEPISPVSDHGTNFETISPAGSPIATHGTTETQPQFENISEDEDEDIEKKKKEEIQEGKFSPVQESDNELNFNDENSNDSGYNIIENETKPTVEESIPPETSHKEGEDVDDDEIEAPMPSPFSDFGDLEDITESDGQIISDILKDTDATEQQFEFKNENYTEKRLPPDKVAGDVESGDERAKSTEKEETCSSGNNENVAKDRTLEEIDKDKEEHEEKDNEKKGVGEKDETQVPGYESKEKEDIQKDDASKDIEGTVVEGKDDEEKMVEIEKEKGSEKKGEDKKEDEEEEGEDAGDLIADIFGESDEEEEFEGFADEEMPEGEDDREASDEEGEPATVVAPPEEEKKDESSDDEPRIPARDFVNDFDVMLEKKKAQKKRRIRKDVDIISDNDDIIAAMIKQMKEAAEEDRMLNQSGKAATKKLKMLASVVSHLRKSDIQGTLIDCGVLHGMKEWLTPLPDHALPHIHIRKLFLQILLEFPPLDKSALKSSGIGRAVMLLFKHPKETRDNRHKAGKIVSNWARPIFNVSTNFLDMSKEEREDRDKKSMLLTKRKDQSEEVAEPKRTKLDEDDMENKPRKPGDKGWCARARVPHASSRDYVNRPISKLDAYEQTRALNTKKPTNRYEKHALKMKGKRLSKAKAMDISLSGSKMEL